MAVIKAVEVKVEPRIRTVELYGGLPGRSGTDGDDGIDGADGRSVTGASIDGSGHLILTFSSAPSPVDVGDVTGNDGADGRSVTGASIDGSGHLILTFSSAPSPVDVGDVTGNDGADGRSVTGASIDGSGHLILTFSSAPSPVDVGDVTGNDGTDGTDGVSVVSAAVDGSYHLILTLSDASTIDAGYVRGPAGSGTGDVVGVAPSVAGNFAAYTDTTGKEIEDSGMSPASFATAAQGVTADGAIQGPGTVTSGNLLMFSGTTGKAVAEMSFATLWALTKTLTNTTFDAAGTGNALSNIATSMFASGVIDTDGTLVSNSDTKIASQKAVKTYADQIIAAADVMVFKGVIDCSANPDYPAADRGWTYRVSVAGKIGGASGINVEAGDILLCLTDGTVSGDQATVGTNWSVIQVNIDGAVVGPSSGVDGVPPLFDGTSGRLLKSAGSLSAWRTAVGLAIGSAVQAWSGVLDTLGGLTGSNDDFIQKKSGAFTTRTPTQVTADLIAMVGDGGSGGTKGLVPAPAAGDAAANKFLNANGAWAAAGGGPLEYVQSATASGAASIDFTTGFSTDYDEYIFDFIGVYPASDAVALQCLISENAGSSYLATAYAYSNPMMNSAFNGSRSESATHLQLAYQLDNAPASGSFGQLKLFQTATKTTILSQLTTVNDTAAETRLFLSSGWRATSSRANAIRFIMSSGNINGVIRMYRAKNS